MDHKVVVRESSEHVLLQVIEISFQVSNHLVLCFIRVLVGSLSCLFDEEGHPVENLHLQVVHLMAGIHVSLSLGSNHGSISLELELKFVQESAYGVQTEKGVDFLHRLVLISWLFSFGRSVSLLEFIKVLSDFLIAFEAVLHGSDAFWRKIGELVLDEHEWFL